MYLFSYTSLVKHNSYRFKGSRKKRIGNQNFFTNN